MGDDFVAPVKVLLKALDTGIKLSNRILESASSASATKALQISETAPNVQKSLERTSQAIRDAYRQTWEACGVGFTQALIEDKSISNRLKELKNEVRDKIDECSDFEDDPDSFDPVAFANIQKESQKCYASCISIFNGMRAQILEARIDSPVNSPRDDRASLASMRAAQAPVRKPLPPPVSQLLEPEPVPPLQVDKLGLEPSAVEPAKPKSPWAIHGPSQFDMGLTTQKRQPSRDISPSSLPQQQPVDEQTRHIAKEVVRYRISANDDFLERRRQSKIFFQNELRRHSAARSPSISSMDRPSTADRRISGTIEENRVSEVFNDGPLRASPRLESSAIATSPIDGRISAASSNGYEQMVSRQRSLGQHSQDARHSRGSSFLHEGTAQRQDLHRQDSTNSQDSIFGLRAATQSPPLSPPLSGPSRPGSLNVENLATTLRTPIFGQDVPDGMEVANGAYDFSSEKIFVTTNDLPHDQNYIQQATPTASMKSIDCPMRHDTSFYQYRGFCEGAATLIKGRTGEEWYKIVKRPLGNYSATISAKCHKCNYEVGFNDLQKDKILDLTGIYMNCGIRWRQRFMTKSHLRATTINAGVYACVFCVEEHKTIEEHDATVFFSIQQLFRHLSKHPQPLPRVPGINVIYGVQPLTVLDFDIHFTTPIPRRSEFGMADIHQKVATRPSGHASVTHHPKTSSSDARDPDGQPVLHFAVGARIVGITFPDRFKGEWCSGYHDGDKGSFPANTVLLEQPPAEDYLMNAKSTLVATARWNFKPKDTKDARWLKFSRGEKIMCIGYSFVDSWCWSGQNSSGKWGIFPRAFVENLVDGSKVNMATSPATRSSGFSLSSFSLGRKSSRQDRHERSMSVRSTSSGGSIGVIMEAQPGLEVATSPSQQIRTVGSWRS